MSNDLIEKRNERTKQRKARKQRIDSLIGLSRNDESKGVKTLSASVATITDTNQTARLLDEGFCDNGFILKKGALEKYLNGQNEYVTGWEMIDGAWQRTEVLNLTDEFIGTVNLGHKDFATDPFILGEFKKSDLELVDIENDRKALNVNVRLDEESMFVKELRRQPYDIGVSAEFYYHVDWDATEALEAEYGMWMPVIDEIFIFAYGLVGECGNVNSSGLELKGEPMEKDNIILTDPNVEEEKLGVEEVEIPTEAPSEETTVEELSVVEEAEDNEPVTEEVTEEAEEAEAEESTEGEEVTVEEVEEEDEEDDDDEAEEIEDADEDELAIVTELKEQIQTLTNKVTELAEANAKLKKTNRKLSAKYQGELDKKKRFKEELKGLSVELLPDEEKKPEEEKMKVLDKNYVRDGIGEI